MRAVVKVSPGTGGSETRTVPDPEVGSGEVLVKVVAAGICGTDMQIYHWAPRMARRMVLPRVLGHEVCGVVEALGPGVGGVTVGQRVELAPLASHILPLEEAARGFELIVEGEALKPILVPGR